MHLLLLYPLVLVLHLNVSVHHHDVAVDDDHEDQHRLADPHQLVHHPNKRAEKRQVDVRRVAEGDQLKIVAQIDVTPIDPVMYGFIYFCSPLGVVEVFFKVVRGAFFLFVTQPRGQLNGVGDSLVQVLLGNVVGAEGLGVAVEETGLVLGGETAIAELVVVELDEEHGVVLPAEPDGVPEEHAS